MKDIRRRTGSRNPSADDTRVRIGNYVFNMEICLSLARCMDSNEIILHIPQLSRKSFAFMGNADNRFIAFFLPINIAGFDGIPDLTNWNFCGKEEK